MLSRRAWTVARRARSIPRVRRTEAGVAAVAAEVDDGSSASFIFTSETWVWLEWHFDG
jgi:hypothetical protein